MLGPGRRGKIVSLVRSGARICSHSPFPNQHDNFQPRTDEDSGFSPTTTTQYQFDNEQQQLLDNEQHYGQ